MKRIYNRDNSPLITVVIAALNCGALLRNTLESALIQESAKMEVVVVDGLSHDDTVDVIQDYRRRFTEKGAGFQWVSEKDKGIYDALNKGIRIAKGRYVIFMGAGDRFTPGIFHNVGKNLTTGKYDIVYGNIYDKELHIINNGKYDVYKMTLMPIHHQAIFHKKDLFERLGYYDLKYPISADNHFIIKCFSPENKLSVKYVRDIIAIYEGGGVSSLRSDERYQSDLPEIIQKYLGEDALAYYRAECPGRDARRADEVINVLLRTQKIRREDRFVVYGTANWGQHFYNALTKKEMTVIAFSDSDPQKWGIKRNGIEIIPPEAIQNAGYDKILIASSKWPEIREKLADTGYDAGVLIRGI